MDFWKDKEKRIVIPTLFSEEAEKLAQVVGENGGKNKNKRSQLRKFFDEVVRLNTSANSEDSEGKPFDFILPQLHMLIAQAAYAKGRGLITEEFFNFIKDGINNVEDKDDLKVFTRFFEAFMGFYRIYRPN